jgi:hypothetical protein
MIYNVWSWYDVKITQNYLLVLFLINIYSQDYNCTLKYSYGHYMVFVVSITIFSVLQFLFCLQLFIFWLIITTLYFTSSNMKISIFWQCFLEDFFTGYGPYRNTKKQILIQYHTEMDFLLTCYIWWVGNIIFWYEIRCFIMFKLHITNGKNSCLKLYNETYLLDKAW